MSDVVERSASKLSDYPSAPERWQNWRCSKFVVKKWSIISRPHPPSNSWQNLQRSWFCSGHLSLLAEAHLLHATGNFLTSKQQWVEEAPYFVFERNFFRKISNLPILSLWRSGIRGDIFRWSLRTTLITDISHLHILNFVLPIGGNESSHRKVILWQSNYWREVQILTFSLSRLFLSVSDIQVLLRCHKRWRILREGPFGEEQSLWGVCPKSSELEV